MTGDPEQDDKARLARRLLGFVTACSAGASALEAVRLQQHLVWQQVAQLTIAVVHLALCGLGLRIARSGAPERGVEVAYAATIVTPLLAALVVALPLTIIGLAVAFFVVVTAPRVLPLARVDRWVYSAVALAIALAALEMIELPTRLPGPRGDGLELMIAGACVLFSLVAAREFSRFPVQTKLALVCLGVGVAPLVVTGFDSHRQLATLDLEVALKDMSDRSLRAALSWDGFLLRQHDPLRWLAASEALAAACAGDPARVDEAERRMLRLISGPHNLIRAAALWDGEGRRLAAVGERFPLRGAPGPGIELADDVDRGDQIVLAVQVRRGEAAPLGVLAVALRAGLVREWAAAAASAAHARVVVRDRRDRVLYSNAPAGLADALPSFASLGPHEIGGRATPELPLAQPAGGRALWLEGARALVGVARIDSADWTLAVVRDETDLERLATERERRGRWLLLIAASVASLAAFLLGRKLSAPLVQLGETMARFTGGNTEVRAPFTSRDEIGELARRFDLMAEQVGGLLRSLELQASRLQAEVAERSEQELKLQRMNAELSAATDQALAASRAKSTFLAHMSHELRTPLNAIIGYGEMLQEDADERGQGERSDDAGRIVRSALHLLEIINDILDLSKIEAGKMDMALEEFDAVRAAREVVEAVRPMAAANANEVSLRVEGEPLMMYSDRLKLRQALLNLLSNAAKFTERGEIELSVEARRVGELACLIFRVRDTGVGIPEAARAGLFDPFTQVSYPAVRKQSGTGLGLAITRRLCRMMGGEIEVHSELGVGSTFTMTIPATYGGTRESGSWRPLRGSRRMEDTGRGRFF